MGLGDEDPAVDRWVVERGGLTTTIIAVSDPSEVVAVATELVDAGVQSIELCGAFGPKWVTEVIAATDGRVPVGGVSYGAESVPALAGLIASVNA